MCDSPTLPQCNNSDLIINSSKWIKSSQPSLRIIDPQNFKTQFQRPAYDSGSISINKNIYRRSPQSKGVDHLYLDIASPSQTNSFQNLTFSQRQSEGIDIKDLQLREFSHKYFFRDGSFEKILSAHKVISHELENSNTILNFNLKSKDTENSLICPCSDFDSKSFWINENVKPNFLEEKPILKSLLLSLKKNNTCVGFRTDSITNQCSPKFLNSSEAHSDINGSFSLESKQKPKILSRNKIVSFIGDFETAIDVRMGIVKISNITWDLSSSEVVDFINGFACKELITKDHVHIPIDWMTGKTKADVYVQLPSPLDVLRTIHLLDKKILKGRAMSLVESSEEEIYTSFFPSSLPRFYYKDYEGYTHYTHVDPKAFFFDNPPDFFNRSSNQEKTFLFNEPRTVIDFKFLDNANISSLGPPAYRKCSEIPNTINNQYVNQTWLNEMETQDHRAHLNDEVPVEMMRLSDNNEYEFEKEQKNSIDSDYECIITQQEVNRLLVICIDYKANFSRRCAERPFEHVISMLRLAPWHRLKDDEVKCLRNLSQGAKSALTEHIQMGSSVRRGVPAIESNHVLGEELLARLVDSITLFPAFI